MQGGSLSSLGISGTGVGGVDSLGRSSRLPHDEARLCFELLFLFRRNMLCQLHKSQVRGNGTRARVQWFICC